MTTLRLFASPLLFIAAYVPFWTSGRFALGAVIVCWVLFVLIELSDMLDGLLARTQDIVTDFGALWDPFADVVSRLTYFAVFAGFSIVPMWMFMLILYREFGMLFVRGLMLRDGVVVSARIGGKLKAVSYAITGVVGLLLYTRIQLGVLFTIRWLAWYANGAMLLSVVLAWVSFLDYMRWVSLRRNANRNQ